MKTLFSILSILLINVVQAFAGGLSGVTKDAAGKPVSGAVILLMRDSSNAVIKASLSDAGGTYLFENIGIGSYILRVQMTAYSADDAHVNISSESDHVKTDFTLLGQKKELNAVIVLAKKPLIEAHADRLVVNVDASIANAGSTAFEVLQRAPGVQVDNNDNISMKGKAAGVNVMIDGRLVPVQGADLANLLKGMPSGSIDKIELITNPGARYDAAGTAGIINIRTKKEKRGGLNGSVTAGYGQGIYPKYNGGAALNYRSGKWNLTANYNYNRRNGFNELILQRHFYNTGVPGSTYDQHNYATMNFRNSSGTLGADYTCSPKTTIGISLSGGDNGYGLNGNNHTTVQDAAGATASYFDTKNASDNTWSNYSVNLNLQQKLDTAGSELTVDADYARYGNTTVQNLATLYTLPDGSMQQPDYRLRGTLDGYTDIKSLKADYTKPLKGGAKLEAGLKTSYVTADNNPAFWDGSSGTDVFDSSKSNHFIYTENINAAYLNFNKDWKDWGLQAGLRAEQTVAAGHQLINDYRFDRNYMQLFLSIALTRHLDKNNDVGLTLSRRIERPNYQQLNPFKSYIDPSSIHEGNPYLNPAFTYAAELNYTFKSRFLTQFSYSRTTDGITQVILPEANQVTVITEKNLATNTVYALSGTYPLQLRGWWSAMVNANVYYSRYAGNLGNTPLDAGTAAATLSVQNTFTLPWDMSAELSGWYQSPQRYGYMELQSMSGISGGIQKSFLKKSATLKLGFTDLMRQQNPSGDNNFRGYREHFVVIRDTRAANLSFTYRFGKRGAGMRRRQRGAEEELRRAGSSGQ